MNRFVVIAIGIIVILVISGCTSTGQYAGLNGESTAVKSVKIFGLVNTENWDADSEDDGIAFSIAPVDASGNLVNAPGILRTFIYENTGTYLEPKRGTLLQSGKIDITVDHYDYFSTKDLRFGISEDFPKTLNGYGVLAIEFTTDWTSSGSSETFKDEYGFGISIPQYTEYEKEQILEEIYEGLSVDINSTKRGGNFEVNLKRAGYYSKTGNIENKDLFLRVDLEVKNIGSKREYFTNRYVTVIDNFGEQYDVSLFDSSFENGDLFPGVKRSGYILFDTGGKIIENATVVIEVGRDYYNNELFLPYEVNLKPIFNDLVDK